MGNNHTQLRYLKTAGIILCMFFPVLFSFGQISNISGIVNSYYSIIEVIPSRSCVRVSNPAGLSTVNKVMIVQMKGASINTTNASLSTWGDTTSLADAGNYEINYICYVNGDTAYLVYQLLNNYTAPGGKVQLVAFAEYTDANVIDTLKAQPWNNTTGTGGVIAIDVTNTLTLNAPISANASGFRGGSFLLSSGTCSNFSPATNYAYNGSSTSPQNGAYKGEGVADFVITQSGGRGAPANGGGGGNNHNNSGGGGANLSAGGRGGGNSSSAGCTTTLRGEAGKALNSYGGQKIFLGGGGGAGHVNNGGSSVSTGGHGGGIIFIHANQFAHNGYKIIANGGTGGNSASDGAGGGGAGGTIILDFNIDPATINAEANGGAGGNSSDGNNIGRCYGGGGGGSGGAIYFSNASLPGGTNTATGGTGGLETGREASCAAAVPGLVGNTGQLISNYSYRISSTFSSFCGSILPVKMLSFDAFIQENKVLLKWKIADPSMVEDFIIEKKTDDLPWTAIGTVTAVYSSIEYTSEDRSPVIGNNYYRIRIMERNSIVTYSSTKHIAWKMTSGDLTIFPNPATDKLTIRGKYAMAELEILDVNGKKLHSLKINGNSPEIRLPVLAKGVYLISVNEKSTRLVIR